MYNGKYSGTELVDVINLLISYMDKENAEKMASDLDPNNKLFRVSFDRAYELYEKAMNGELHKPVIW